MLMCCLAITILIIIIAAGAAAAKGSEKTDLITVPMLVEAGRAFVDLSFNADNQAPRIASFWLDTGGGAFLLTEKLAGDLGLTWGEAFREEGLTMAKIMEIPQPRLGDIPLKIDGNRAFVVLASDNLLPKVAQGLAEGLLPGHILANYHLVFDYPKGLFTLARPGYLEPLGQAIAMQVSKKMGFPRVELEIGGSSYGFLLDSGASFTIVSEAVLKSWGKEFPQWPRYDGAYGDARTLGGQTLETMFVSSAVLGDCKIGEFGVVSQKEGVFERWISPMMAAPIIGALGGNVLQNYRVELDYANQLLYLSDSFNR